MGTIQKIIDTLIKQGEDKKLNLTKRCEEHSAWLQKELDSIRLLIATNPRDESNKESAESGLSEEAPSSSNNNKGTDEESSRQKRKSPETSSTGIDGHFSPEHKRNSSSEFEKLALLAGLPADLNRLKKEQLLAKLEEKGNTTWTMKALKKELIDALKDALFKDHNTSKNSTASVTSMSTDSQQPIPLVVTATEAIAAATSSAQTVENSDSSGRREIRISSATAEPVSVRMELSSPQSSPPVGSGAKQPRKGASLMSELRSLVNVSDSSLVIISPAATATDSEQHNDLNKYPHDNAVALQAAEAEMMAVDTDFTSNEEAEENSRIAAEHAARQQRHRESQIRKSQLQPAVDPPAPSQLQQQPAQESRSVAATSDATKSLGSSSSSTSSVPCIEAEDSSTWFEVHSPKPSLSSVALAAPAELPPAQNQMVYATVSPVKGEDTCISLVTAALPKSTASTNSASASQPASMRFEAASSSTALGTSGTAATAAVKKPSNLMGGQVSFIEKPAAPVEKLPAKPIVPALEKARQLREAEEARLAEKLRIAKAAEEARLRKKNDASNTATASALSVPSAAANNVGVAGAVATVKPVTTTSSSTWDRLKGIATGVAGSSSSASGSTAAASVTKKPGLLSSVFPGKKLVAAPFSNPSASSGVPHPTHPISTPTAAVSNAVVGANGSKASGATPASASAAGLSSKETASSAPAPTATVLPTPPAPSGSKSDSASDATPASTTSLPPPPVAPAPAPQQVLREVAVVEQDHFDEKDAKTTRVVDIDEEYTGDRDEYEIDEGSDDSGSGTDDEESEKAKLKRIPEWARGQQLREALEKQYGLLGGHSMIDPDIIFPEVSTCSLEEIFGAPAGRNGQYSRRGSSAHWERDQLTMIEKRTYRSQMGYHAYATTPGASVIVAPGTGGVSGGAGRISPIQQQGQGGVSRLLGLGMASKAK